MQNRQMSYRLTKGIRRLSISLILANTRHEKDRKRIQQLKEAQNNGEAPEAHGLSTMLVRRGMGGKKKALFQDSRFKTIVQRKEQKLSNKPSTKVGAMDCEPSSATKSKA